MIEDMINQAQQASDIVNDAIARGDFASLNERVRESLDYARTSAAERAAQYAEESRNRDYSFGQSSRRASDRLAGRTTPNQARAAAARASRVLDQKRTAGKPAERVLFKEPSNAGAVVLIAGGAILAAGLGLASIPAHMVGGGLLHGIGIVLDILALGGLGMLFGGIVLSTRSKRFAVYKELLKDKKYADVSQLAEAVHRSEAKTVKELKALVAEGAFPEGHFDKSEKTFMVTNEMFDHYKDMQARSDELKKAEEEKEASYAGLPPKAREVVKKGEAYVAQIRANNDAIPDPVVSEKLDRMEQITAHIFAEVRRNPKLADGLNMLMEYYLPTTDKLITAYRDMDQQTIQGDNIKTAKAEIEGTLDTVNDAFERILDGFYEDDAVDVSTDISVMKTVMKQQGLTADEMKIENVQGVEASMEKGPTLQEMDAQVAQAQAAEAGAAAQAAEAEPEGITLHF